MTREDGDRYRKSIHSTGGSKEAATMYRDLTGSGPQTEPLLKKRGVAVGGASQ